MTDRDLLEPVDPDGRRKRRPGAGALGSVSDALARLVPRPRGDDGSYDAGTGIAMSDEELREAFRLASLTVTPATLGRPSRREDPGPPDGEVPSDAGPDVPSPLRTPTVVLPPAEATAAAGGSTAVPEASPIGVPAPVPESAPASVAESAPESVPTSLAVAGPLPHAPATGPAPRLDAAPDAGRPIRDLPDPVPPDQVQLPGNLGFSVDDFFGGLVRRIERRP